MKLNLDCIRSILLEVEKCGFNETLPISELENLLPEYYNEDIRYNCLKLYEAGYIDAVYIDNIDSAFPYIHEIIDIRYPGHEFLATIRKEENWNKTKEIGSKVGAFSLSMAGAIAEGVATAYFKRELGIL